MSAGDAARKFQRDMQKIGLGVQIKVGGNPAITVTSWCKACGHVAAGSPERCPKCDASYE